MNRIVALLIFSMFFCSSQGQDLEWMIGFGTANYDLSREIDLDDNGGVYISGITHDFPTFYPDDGNIVAEEGDPPSRFVAKVDDGGTPLWVKHFTGIVDNSIHSYGNMLIVGGAFFNEIDFDPGPGVVTVAEPDGNCFISQFTLDGEFNWSVQFGNGRIRDLTSDENGNIYATGHFIDTADFDPGSDAFVLNGGDAEMGFVAKFDSSGNMIWVKSFGRSATNQSGWNVEVNEAGNVFICGVFDAYSDFGTGASLTTIYTQGETDSFIAMYDAEGNFHWAQGLGGSGNDYPGGIASYNNDIYFSGGVSGSGYVVVDGEWINFDSGSDNYADGYLMKISALGEIQWVKFWGGEFTAYAPTRAVNVDPIGNVYCAGAYRGNVVFGPGGIAHELNNSDSYGSGYILKFEPDGNLNWVEEIDSRASISDLKIDQLFNIHGTGTYRTSIDNNGAQYDISTLGQEDVFVFKFTQDVNLNVDKSGSIEQLLAYPNPTQGQVRISQANQFKIQEVRVVDAQGRLVSAVDFDLNSPSTEFNLDGPAGLYFLECKDEQKTYRTRLIKR